jgi:hypothetical protein
MGHEHVQRYGSDEAAFRAMRERRSQRSSYLLDTFDTLNSGLPTAYQLIQEEPGSGDSIRFDSGDKLRQYEFAVRRAQELRIHPVMILEDGLDAQATREFEALAQKVGWAPTEQFYGYGGFIVARPMASSYTRDRVASVYKLSQTGKVPTMKFGNELAEGKQSVPGKPVVFRRQSGTGPVGLIGQEGEPGPRGVCPAHREHTGGGSTFRTRERRVQGGLHAGHAGAGGHAAPASFPAGPLTGIPSPEEDTMPLPIPQFHDEQRVGALYLERAAQVTEEARRYAKAHGVKPAREDSVKIAAFGIDVQVAFCQPEASLFVPARWRTRSAPCAGCTHTWTASPGWCSRWTRTASFKSSTQRGGRTRRASRLRR